MENQVTQVASLLLNHFYNIKIAFFYSVRYILLKILLFWHRKFLFHDQLFMVHNVNACASQINGGAFMVHNVLRPHSD